MLSGPRATVKKARKLRRAMSFPEVLLWQRLKLRPEGVKFRRQHPAGRYVLDFFCSEARTAVEVDGASHDMGARPEHDAVRDAWLREAGIEVVRVPAMDVVKNADGVADAIVRLCLDRAMPLHHLASRDGPPPRAKLGEEQGE